MLTSVNTAIKAHGKGAVLDATLVLLGQNNSLSALLTQKADHYCVDPSLGSFKITSSSTALPPRPVTQDEGPETGRKWARTMWVERSHLSRSTHPPILVLVRCIGIIFQHPVSPLGWVLTREGFSLPVKRNGAISKAVLDCSRPSEKLNLNLNWRTKETEKEDTG